MTRFLIILGILCIIIGLLWPFIQKLGLGHLPGDISIQTKNFSFYFPLTTCIILSLLISLIIWLINKFLH